MVEKDDEGLKRIIDEEIEKINCGFDKLLMEEDSSYTKKVNFIVNYNELKDYFKIEVVPVKKGFDSHEYFGSIFRYNSKGEDGKAEEKLEKFLRENNVVVLEY